MPTYRLYLVEYHDGDVLPSNPREIVEFEGTLDEAEKAFRAAATELDNREHGANCQCNICGNVHSDRA